MQQHIQQEQEAKRMEQAKHEQQLAALKPRQQFAQDQYNKYAHAVAQFVQRIAIPTEASLIPNMYKPALDHPVTLRLLQQFEHGSKGQVAPLQSESEDEDTAVRRFMELKRKEKDLIDEMERKKTKTNVTVQIAQPNMTWLQQEAYGGIVIWIILV